MSVVALRCDGDGRVGAGHVARCLQIAKAFRMAGDDAVLVGRYEGTAAALVDAAGLPALAPADASAGVPADAELAVVDSYEIPAAELTAAASTVPTAVVLDFGAAPPGTIGLDPHAGADTDVGGLDYAPVDPRYSAVRRTRGFERALISVGGGDAGDALRQEAAAVVRAAGLVADVPGLGGPAPAGLLDAVAAADVAIGAAGVTAYEMACAGLPAAVVPVAGNQQRIAATLAERGIVLADGDPAALLARLRDPAVRAQLARRGPAAIDGYGAFRVRDALKAAAAGRELPRVLRYRPAAVADSPLQLAWRNDPATRRSSRNGAMVSRREHDSWFARVLADATRTLLIAEDANGPVASVRFDFDGEAAEISVVVDPIRRGGGIGRQAVREASELMLAARPELDRIEATVLAGNDASARTFARAGFAAAPGEGGDRLGFVMRRAHLGSALP